MLNNYQELVENNVSRVAFLIILFTIFSSGYINNIFSCQLQKFLVNSLVAKHIIGIFLVFIFIMLETGGYDFNKEEEEIVKKIIDSIITSVSILLTKKFDLFSNKVNKK